MTLPLTIPLTVCDAHVHFYPDYDLTVFLDSAWANFQKIAAQLEPDSEFIGVLMLTEAKRDNWFQALSDRAHGQQSAQDTWQFYATDEPESLRAQGPQNRELFICAGRQIVTAENLEVLALATTASKPDGAPIQEVIDWVQEQNGIPVIPWGFGKWWGKRGDILSSLLKSNTNDQFLLGDNSGRPWFMGNPKHFATAQQQHRHILPGSDPLPFASESWRAGCAGFSLSVPIDPDRPAGSLRNALKNPHVTMTPYIRRERLMPFVRNQVAMQVRKRTS